MKLISLIIFLLIAFLLGCTQLKKDEDCKIADAAFYYNQNCFKCHSLSRDYEVDAPYIGDINNRRTNDWIFKFLNNPDSFLSNGENQTHEVYSRYSNKRHPEFEISKGKVNCLVEFLKFETSN